MEVLNTHLKISGAEAAKRVSATEELLYLLVKNVQREVPEDGDPRLVDEHKFLAKVVKWRFHSWGFPYVLADMAVFFYSGVHKVAQQIREGALRRGN